MLGLQLERDALVAKTDVLERCLLTGKEEPLPSNEQSPTTSGGQPTSKVRSRVRQLAPRPAPSRRESDCSSHVEL